MVNFGNPAGIYALLTLIPLIILYLIRPKPKELVIPSLMFLLQDRGIAKRHTFLKTILRDLLFLLHLLALLGLAFSIAEPIFNIPYDSAAKSTVVVLDMSASMQTTEKGESRFERATDAARKAIKGETSVILAENTPLVVQEGVSSTRATAFLRSVSPKATATNIGDAMMLAEEFTNGGEGRVVVVSDFLVTDGPDPEVPRKVLESKGLVVDLIDVGSGGSNVGIVDLAVDKFQTKVVMKNFDAQDRTITVQVKNSGKVIHEKTLTLLPKSIESLSFNTMGGVTIVEIPEKDDLMVDNRAFISAPNATAVQVALITNTPSTFIQNALESAGNVLVTRYEPPLTGAQVESLSERIIVISGFDTGLLHSTLFKNEFAEKVRQGATLVITAQPDLDAVNFGELLPVQISGKGGPTTITAAVINQITKDVEFGAVSEHFIASAPNESVVLAAGTANEPIIALREYGGGKVVYYGVDDAKSDFKYSPSYPIFWANLLDVVTGVKDIGNFNQRTGRVLVFPEAKWVTTPSGKIKTSRLLLDETGFYEIDGSYYAANLLNEKESNIAEQSPTRAVNVEDYKERKVTKRKDVNFGGYLAALAFALLALELFYIKYRGDF